MLFILQNMLEDWFGHSELKYFFVI